MPRLVAPPAAAVRSCPPAPRTRSAGAQQAGVPVPKPTRAATAEAPSCAVRLRRRALLLQPSAVRRRAGDAPPRRGDADTGGWGASSDAAAGDGEGWWPEADAESEEERRSSGSSAARASWGGARAVQQPGGDPPTGGNAEDEDDAPTRADVTPLSREEQQALLPATASGPQYAYYWGPFDSALQRVFASLLGCLVTANAAPLVAVPAGLYFLWAPVALAARRNAPLRSYPYAGVWHARVLQAGSHAARLPGGIVFDAMGDAFLPRRRASSVTRVLVGDDSGARLQMEVPLAQEHSEIRPGDEVELVVVSDEPSLQRFRAVREAYLPELGLWLSEYPFVERRAFRAVSDAIAAARAQQEVTEEAGWE